MVVRAFVLGLALALSLGGCVSRQTRAPSAPTVVVVEAVAGQAPVVVPGEAKRPTSAWSPRAEVDVEWQGSWWPATLLERRGPDRWLVHYDGWEQEWDEIVAEDRIRDRSEAVPAEGEAAPDDVDP